MALGTLESQVEPVEQSTSTEHVETGVTQTGTEQAGEAGTSAESLDGRRGPLNVRQTIKSIAEWAQNGAQGALPEGASPEVVKQLGTSYFREQAYRQHFPTPQDAASAKSLIEGVGGVDGIKQIQERISGYDAQEAGLESGDPAVLDSFFQDYPAGAAALAPHYLELLQKANPEALAAAIQPHIVAMLDGNNFYSHVAAMAAEKDPARKDALVNELAQWAERNKQAKTAPTTARPAVDTSAKQKQDEEQRKFYAERVEFHVSKSIESTFKKIVDNYAASNKLSEKQAKHYRNVLQDRLVAQMNADKTYLDQVDIRRKAGAKPEEMAKFVAGEFQKRLEDADPKTSLPFLVANEIYGVRAPAGTTTGVVKPDTPKQAADGGPIKVSQRPRDEEFADYPDLDMDLIKGRARLKNGRFVTWR